MTFFVPSAPSRAVVLAALSSSPRYSSFVLPRGFCVVPFRQGRSSPPGVVGTRWGVTVLPFLHYRTRLSGCNHGGCQLVRRATSWGGLDLNGANSEKLGRRKGMPREEGDLGNTSGRAVIVDCQGNATRWKHVQQSTPCSTLYRNDSTAHLKPIFQARRRNSYAELKE